MPLTPSDIANKAGQEAANILGALPGLAADGAAAYVKNGTPPSIIPNIGVGLARQACRRYADNPDSVPGSVAAGFERVCRPYLDDIGYGQAPELEKPFAGGQCDGVCYLVSVTNGEGSNETFQTRGPIGGVRTTTLPGGGQLEVFSRSSVNFPDSTSCFPLGAPGWRGTGIGGTSWNADRTATITAIAVKDGGDAGACGNPPPVLKDPVPPPSPGPQVEPYNPGPGIDIDIDLTIGPGGDINFNIGTGPITIDPFGGGGDGGGGDGGGAPGSGLPPGDIGQPGAEEPTGEDGVASGCAPPNSVLVGVKVNILSAPPFASEYDPLVRRGACYVYMGTTGNLALEPAGVALRSGQMFFAPVDNLTCWEVNANSGYVLQVIPYYRALEPQEV